jgi:hypothetical protein
MSVIGSNILAGASGQGGGYNLTRSLRFRSSASAYLSRTFGTPTNQKIWTYSTWLKRGALGSSSSLLGNNNGTNQWYFWINSSNTLYIGDYNNDVITTVPVLRDPSGWYHIVLSIDTTQATATNRIKLWVNNQQYSYTQGASFPSQNYNLPLNQASLPVLIGGGVSGWYLDGYLTEVNFIDGQALTPSSFGETNAQTGVWQPKRYAGTYGTNGFYLPFTDNSALTSGSNAGLGKDFSGNGNYWNTNNISITAGSTYDSMTDVPTLTSATAANFCTLNPLSVTTGTVSEGNLKYVGASSSKRINGTVAVSSGKWYWEVTLLNAPESPRSSSSAYNGFGFGLATTFDSSAGGTSSTDWLNLKDNGYYKNFSNANTDSGVSFASGDVLAVAVDLDANTFTFYRNNTSLATGTIGVTAGTVLVPAMYSYNGSFGAMACNFGQRPFAYTPPTGFVALNTFNLPTPTIGATASTQANKYFDATLYTGNGSTQSITNSGSMQPSMVWVKSRSNAYNNVINDAIRGSTKLLITNGTDAEQTETQSITSFNSNGFSLGTAGTWNQNGSTFVAWQWNSPQSGSSNTDGSITSTVSANTSAGFSVVTYTGTGVAASFGHGLNVPPKMVIVKRRNSAVDWAVYHASLGGSYRLLLNTTGASTLSTAFWDSSDPSDEVVGVGTSANTNASGGTYVAYCFAEILGFSKMGSYTGITGNADSSFIYTGFKPAFVLIKRTDSTGYWVMLDNKRKTYNVNDAVLYANASNAEATGQSIDFLSNGFKLRTTDSDVNSSGTYIYYAVAENPFKYSLGR